MDSGFYYYGASQNSRKRTFFAVMSILVVVGVVGVISLYHTTDLLSNPLSSFQLGEIEFKEFIRKHDKSYQTDKEYTLRLDIFRRNVAFINEHNAKGLSWTLAVNEFADLTYEEFRNRVGLLPIEIPENIEEYTLPVKNIPEQVDWVAEGKVTSIKDQGQCGSCWAFSTTGAIEGAWAISQKELVLLSEQQLVDCSSDYGNQGCNGGLMNYAFTYVIENGGIEGEADYPYKAVQETCKADDSKIKAKISKFTNVKQNSEANLKQAVAQQPVSIAVQADEPVWQFYSKGVVTSNCGQKVDHGVLVVGYGFEDKTPYWKVKNSWGPYWGEDGYIKILRNDAGIDGGLCGISTYPSYPVV